MQRFDTQKKMMSLATVLLFVLLMFLTKTSTIFPDASTSGIFIASLMCGYSFPLLLFFCGINLLYSFSVQTALFYVMPAVFTFFIRLFLKNNKFCLYYIILAFLVASCSRFAFVTQTEQYFEIAIFLAMVFFYAICSHFAFLGIANLYFLRLEQAFCLSVLCVTIVLAIIPFNIANIYLCMPILIFCLLIIQYIFTRERAVVFAILCGIAYSIYYQNTVYLGFFACICLPLYIFSTHKEFFYSLCVFGVFATLIFYFDIYFFKSTQIIIITFALCMIFALFSPLFAKIRKKFQRKDILSKMLINKTRQSLSKKLEEISAVFYEMKELFSAMSVEKLSESEKMEMLSKEIFEKICINCKNERCKSQPQKLTLALNFCITKAVECGKINIANLPPYISNCNNIKVLTTVINQMATTYRKYSLQKKMLDEDKKLLARQLGGISQIFYHLSGEFDKELSTDAMLYEKLKIHLKNYGITCLELLVFSGEVAEVAMVILKNDFSNAKLCKILSKFFAKNFVVEKTQDILGTNTKYIFFKLAPNFDVKFGVASEKKFGKDTSGDAHSLVKLSESKFLIALCDGMGSGEDARQISSQAITLVENFYRANFSSGFILETINTLLSTCFEESYTAMDIIICDLKDCKCDFIKLASPSSYIVNSGIVTLIDTSSTPLGILDQIQPAVISKKLTIGDTIVLVSDGICDSFESESELFEELSRINADSPQDFANILLELALSKNSQIAKDDCTVVAIKII